VAPAGGDGSLGADRRRYGSSAGAAGAATGPMRRLRSEPLSDAEAGEAARAGTGAGVERGGARREDEAARRAKLANWSWWGFRCGCLARRRRAPGARALTQRVGAAAAVAGRWKQAGRCWCAMPWRAGRLSGAPRVCLSGHGECERGAVRPRCCSAAPSSGRL